LHHHIGVEEESVVTLLVVYLNVADLDVEVDEVFSSEQENEENNELVSCLSNNVSPHNWSNDLLIS